MSGDRPRLSREVVASPAFAALADVELPPASALALPETVVQFGTGAFLRGFADYFIDAANRRGAFLGSIVAVSSTGSARDTILNEQEGLFTLAIQGFEGGAARRRFRVISAVNRALSADDAWDSVLELARDPGIRLIISNTTEVGIALDETDSFDAEPPRSFPGKLARFLYERAVHFDFAIERGVIVLPCELIEDNGTTLGGIVGELARRWKLGDRFVSWLADAVDFRNTLVDRIVPGALPRDEAERIERLAGYRDGMITTCEPYALFAIEGDDTLRARLGFADDARIVVTPDIRPYRERKVRVLNGGHTISVAVALLSGLETVREATEDALVGQFLRRVILDEIVPSLDVPDAESFAREVLERFANPYIRHSLIDITLHATTKMRVRVIPSILQYTERLGPMPEALAFGFAAHLAFMRGEIQVERRAAGLPVPEDRDGERITAAWARLEPGSESALRDFTRNVCRDATLWGTDLSKVSGWCELVS
ncbi:MAG TPA: tagaturonate reductase, partial [Gemmatimonadaceae bacterium]|nr:tagaturonate reductase [Gemmatimonadaceae bacterium]